MADPGLYEPLYTPKPLAPELWIVDGPIARMAALGARAPFPTRMTVARLGDGGLWCHSPVAPDEGLFAAIDALGPVRHLVSPNPLHYAHIAAWKRRYSDAIAWASPGVRRRAAGQRIEVRFDADLDETSPPDWSADLDQLRFRGSRFQETVFFHRASATLILTDLIENFEPSKLPAGLRWMARLGGVLDPDGKTPLDMRLTFLGRRGQARACVERMLAWRPERVLLAHGRCYLDNAEAELRRAFRWTGL
jgi:hypothetical protein